MAIPYTYHSKLVMRTPQNPLQTSIGAEDDFLQGLLKDNNFLEALFLASPVLHDELVKYGQGAMSDTKGIKKLIFSLAKYHLRMSSRCTPFGLFSGCAVTRWDDNETSVIIDTVNKLDRHTRFDMHYLCALAQHIAALPFIKNKLLYYPNTAFYKIAEEIRYVEYHYKNGRRKHIISAVLASDYTLDILQAAANGITVQDMINRLIGDEVTIEEAAEFIDEIIAAQLLVSEMEPSVTGSEFLYQIISSLKKINTNSEAAINEITGMLQQINALIKAIDTNTINDNTTYAAITDCLKKFNIPFELNKLFQCDLNINLTENKINSSIKTQIAEALNIINLTNKTIANPNLTAFASRFYERYEDAELPLLEVLDNETGIGYAGQHTGNITPLLDGMAVAGPAGADGKFEWSARDKFLFDKLITAGETRQSIVEFSESEFKDFKNGWDSLPPSISVMFRLLDDDRILLENSGSSSAVNLLARFAHGNKDIHSIIDDVVKDEDEKNPSVIFAEIVHLPESRIGNILLHPSFRKHEIPFLSKSSVPADYQVTLHDLLVSVKGNVVFLRSKKLNKIIIPRLSSAHNYSFGALPIYQFLADLQLQGKQGGILFNWGILENQFKILPRAVYKNVIIKEAQWNFLKKDIELLINKQNNDFATAINHFKETWQLPSLVVLADGDNELLINLDDKLLVDVWLEAVKNRSSFTIKEFLGGAKNSPVKDSAGNLYANQFIAVLMRNTAAYNFPELTSEAMATTEVQRDFALGTEWVYYKLYCGHKTADTVLQTVIHPLVQQLTEDNIIDSFFFIRYNDPHFHLRVRFHITAIEKLAVLLSAVEQYVNPFLQQRLIWNIQNDIYKRELNRYGHQTITEAETLFYHDSIAVLKFLQQTEGDNREQLRWQWTFRAIDEWLNAFNYTTAKKLELLEQMKNSYHKEFNSNKFLKEFLGNKYRTHKSAIEQIMNCAIDETHPLFSLITILKEKTKAMQPVLMMLSEKDNATNSSSISAVMPSYIHMLVNRIVTSSPREHELVIYDLLHCFYKSKIAREKAAPAADKNMLALKWPFNNEKYFLMFKFPHYKQYDEMDCGPSCLRIICKFYSKTFSLEYFRALTYTSRSGTSMLSLSKAAEKLKLRTMAAKLSYDDLLETQPFPCIAYWNQKHFLVVYKIKKNKIYVSDPAHGLLTYNKEEFLKSWCVDNDKGIILSLEPTSEFYDEADEKQTTSEKNFGSIFKYVLKYKREMVQIIAGLVVASLLQVFFPFLTKSVVDIGIHNRDMQFIYMVLLAQLMVFLGKTAIEVLRSYMLLHVSTRVNIHLLSDFFIKLMRLPLGYFDSKMVGDTIQRISDHRRVENFFTSGAITSIFSLLSLVVFGAVLALYSPFIFAVFLVGSLLYILWITLFMKKRAALDYKLFAQMSANQEKNYEMIVGMQEIKLHNAEQKKMAMGIIANKAFKINIKSLSLKQWQSGGAVVINELKNIIITIVAAGLVVKGSVSLGVMLSVSYIIGQLNSPILQLVEFFQSYQDTTLSLNRINEIHNKPDEENIYDQKITEIQSGDICIENLSFKYDNNPVTPFVLKDINITIPANKVTAIVGSSGSGKTTLLKLLMKFYEPTTGTITIGNQQFGSLSNSKWRDKCGVVMQEGYIFNDTIESNIAVGDDVIDLVQLENAARIANIQDFIKTLPMGYKTKIGNNGMGISTGQKQRMLIARAIYKNPDVLFFDEATSALDAKNEKLITENLDSIFKNKTVVIIAHRLSTVKNADNILVLQNGKISESGHHKQLITEKGFYYNLVSNQLELGA